MKPVIFVIDGEPGSGKTKFAKTWLCEEKWAYFHAAPEKAGTELSVGDALTKHRLVCLDDISKYEQHTAKAEIDRLIEAAIAARKQLVLIVQRREEISAIGITLPNETIYSTFTRRHVATA